MTWYGWLIVGVILGIASAAALVAAVGRESEERGGTLTFDSPDARAVFKQRGEATQTADGMRTWDPEDGHPLPVILDARVPAGHPGYLVIHPWLRANGCICPDHTTIIGSCPVHSSSMRFSS